MFPVFSTGNMELKEMYQKVFSFILKKYKLHFKLVCLIFVGQMFSELSVDNFFDHCL